MIIKNSVNFFGQVVCQCSENVTLIKRIFARDGLTRTKIGL